jgi:hypothetical protein
MMKLEKRYCFSSFFVVNKSGILLCYLKFVCWSLDWTVDSLKRVLDFLMRLFGLGFVLSIAFSLILEALPKSPTPNPETGQIVHRYQRNEDSTDHFYVTPLHAEAVRINSILFWVFLVGGLTCSLLQWALKEPDHPESS